MRPTRRRRHKGGRNDAIFTAALKLGSYVSGAGLEEPVVIGALEAAAETNGYTASDGIGATRASIRSGLRGGQEESARGAAGEGWRRRCMTTAP